MFPFLVIFFLFIIAIAILKVAGFFRWVKGPAVAFIILLILLIAAEIVAKKLNITVGTVVGYSSLSLLVIVGGIFLFAFLSDKRNDRRRQKKQEDYEENYRRQFGHRALTPDSEGSIQSDHNLFEDGKKAKAAYKEEMRIKRVAKRDSAGSP